MDVMIRSFNAYRAKRFGYRLTPADGLILLRSLLHTHTELQFSHRYANISFSATLADGANGCRFKDIKYSHTVFWDTIVVPMTDSQEDTAYAEAKAIDGQPYDDIGLASFVSRAEMIKPRKGFWWCTEAVVHCVKRIYPGLPLVPDQTHPTWADTVCRWYFGQFERYGICLNG